ncbi:helix-turn-helix domain-containing protein [Thermicanus aegyptius]|uniref:helix-turn-helix domain-containing protein n=1 Tax=Thermicanus aegyptius TaxID=94009 RepID=UPI0024814335|nr:helix-turn-helix transcriptional regulator [Thermicanus aegyptius]
MRKARLEKNMTHRELSDATGLSVTAISNLERDRFKPTMPNLRKLSTVLGVPISYLGCFETLPENTLGERIRKARLYHGYSKKEFAEIIGVDVKSIQSWEKDLRIPIDEYLSKIREYFVILDRPFQ